MQLLLILDRKTKMHRLLLWKGFFMVGSNSRRQGIHDPSNMIEPFGLNRQSNLGDHSFFDGRCTVVLSIPSEGVK